MSIIWQKIAVFGGPVILTILTAIAGYALTQQTQFTLPIPLPLTILTALLPLFTYFSTLFTHRLLFPPMSHTMAQPRLGLALPIIVIQSIYTTIVFVLSLSYTSLSTTTHCLMDNQWAYLFRTRNTAAIRLIQETLECCGFSEPHDRPWPFPVGQPTDPGYVSSTECQRRTGYTRSCEQRWAREKNGAAMKLVVVGGVVFVCQIIYYVSVLYPQSTGGWAGAIKAITGSGNGAAAERRRNMRALIQADADDDSDRVQEVLDREGEETNAGGGNERRLEAGQNDGPRAETSPLLDGWREHGGHGTASNNRA